MIINSILDTDLYKITMMAAILELFPNAKVSYRFKNRGRHRFNQEFLKKLQKEINLMSTLSLTDEEYLWMKENLLFLKPSFLEYLKNYRFNPNEICCSLDDTNDLVINITGKWHRTILWEVPLMAMISELYFKTINTTWEDKADNLVSEIYSKAQDKSYKLSSQNCLFADFGTRRRRSYDIQNIVIQGLKNIEISTLVGTSNVHFAMKHNLKPIGTMAHEWIQGMQSLESINHCNYNALNNWIRVYNTDLGIALTDTIRTSMFFQNFNKRLARDYDGVRHDSGCPFEFTDKVIDHYKKVGINPKTKVIIFSDGLNVDKAIQIKEYCQNKIQCSFGIGTHFTNDFKNSPALNMVIKLWDVGGFPVVKLSDIPGKENGDNRAIENMKWIVKNQLNLNVD